MAKERATASAPTPPNAKTKAKSYDKWEVQDAMHTMMRAGDIIKDKKLIAAVRKEAASYADEMKEKSARADMLAKKGMISPKQMAKLGAR